jgi:heptosyltransferase-2
VATGPRSIAVIRFSALGDVVLTSPALEALARAWPDAEILFVTKAAFAPLVAHNPHVTRVLALERGESLAHLRTRVRENAPDAVLDLHANLRSTGLRTLTGAPRTVVWNKRSFLHGLAVRLRWRRYHAGTQIAARYHAAVEELVGRELERGTLRSWLAAEDRDTVAEILAAAGGADDDRPLVGMAPGAMWATKRWPVERWGELARRSLEAGWRLLLTGSAAEREVTADVAQQAPGAVDLAGQLTLGQLGAVIARCRAFVANDSGPMHMARALSVPTVAFFGSTDPQQFDFHGHGLMWAAEECAPCSLYGLSRCPRRHFRCMTGLEVDRAWRRLVELVSSGARPSVQG